MKLRIPQPAIEIPGFRFAGVACGLKDDGRRDLALIVARRPVPAAGAFTRNRFAAPPVEIARERLKKGRAQVVVVNTKSANAGTGERGRRLARASCRLAAKLLGVPEDLVVPCSTGKIGLPVSWDKLARGLRHAAETLAPGDFWDAAEAIRTTDAFAKGAFRRVAAGGRTVTVAGLAKGAGMIRPDMATTLVYVLTDAAAKAATLRRLLLAGLSQTFHAISVDGDTSTNDTALLLASGTSGVAIDGRDRTARDVARAIVEVLGELAYMIVADGEGASKVVRIGVIGARTRADAESAARAIGTSVLVRTAFGGGDPNWGRIACAVGYSGAAMRPDRLRIRLGGVDVARKGVSAGRLADVRARRAMSTRDFSVEVDLGLGRGSASFLTCDLGTAYVRFNSQYSS